MANSARKIVVNSYNLHEVFKLLCEKALKEACNCTDAAKLLGIDRNALKRRIDKYNIKWP